MLHVGLLSWEAKWWIDNDWITHWRSWILCSVETCQCVTMPCAVGLSVCRQPQNIFVTFESDGQPCAKIADFGHSRIFSRQRKLHIFHQQASGQFVCGYKLLFRFVVGCWGKRHIYSTTSRILQLQWLCAPQTEPIYSLGCSPNPLSRILACSHTCIHSPNLPFNGINPCNPCNYMSICQRLTF